MCNFVCNYKTVSCFSEKNVSYSVQVNKVLSIFTTLKVNFARQLAVKGGRPLIKCFNAQEDEELPNFY